MKVAFALTMQGLIRALRGRAHALAEEAEARYGRRHAGPAPRKASRARVRRRTEGRDRDEFAGR